MSKVVLLYNQSNNFGLSQDAALIESLLNNATEKFEVIRFDPLQPPVNADIVIHLEVPHPVWFEWAPIQIWMVNPEWCSPNWLPYRESFTQVWVKEESHVVDFGSKAVHVPWAVRGPLKPVQSLLKKALWVLGASENKHAAARAILPLWPADFPLTVTTALDLSGSYPSVTIKQGFLESAELEALNTSSAIHVCISAAEGFGFTAAQAEARSAALLLNSLPVYKEYYGDKPYAAFLETPVTKSSKDHCGYVADFSQLTTDSIREALLNLIPSGELQVQVSEARLKLFSKTVGDQISKMLKTQKAHKAKPPVLEVAKCPPISVLTLTYNRRNFAELAFLNILKTDYPLSKIQWVIVEDSDDVMKSASDKIKDFQNAVEASGLEVTYVMSTKRSIGYKRNLAVKAAKHEICVNMDDDDFYPTTSFRRRVAWLQSTSSMVVGCTMIAMYDLQLGISAVNTPPWALKQSERVSEASFAFYKSYALEHPFPDVQQSEGEDFVSSGNFLEIPPQQILVALNHGTNTSGRVIAGKAETGCFWGWDQKFLTWLHGLVGVQVEAENTMAKYH